MKHKIFVIGVMIAVFFALHLSTDLYAYPWFARRLVDNCNKCHVSFPKTNDYGWYVKSTGYELPKISYNGLAESPIKRAFRYLPVAVRFKLDAFNSAPSDLKGDLTFREIQLISGGSIFNNKVSWWFHKHMVEDNNAVNLFDGTPHEMWAQYNVKFGQSYVNRLGLRYGMSELPLRFSPSKTKVSEIGYAIYNATLGENSFTFSNPQYGIGLKGLRLGGDNFNEVKSTFDLALVNGQGDFSTHKFNQVFGRIGTTIANTMVGAFTYVGSQNLPMLMEEHTEEGEAPADEHTEELMTVDNNFYRLGFDFDMNITPMFNIYGLALYGRDSNPLGLQVANSGNYYGGFIGMDYCPNERLMFQWRFDVVRFGSLPAVEHHEHNEEMAMDEGHDSGGHGHMHGELVTSNTDAMVFGFQFLPLPNFYQLRLTTEYRVGLRGQNDLLLAGFQFAL